jgi:hypothetical protein
LSQLLSFEPQSKRVTQTLNLPHVGYSPIVSVCYWDVDGVRHELPWPTQMALEASQRTLPAGPA